MPTPLTARPAYVQPHGSEMRKGITAFYKVPHALSKGCLHCWMIMNPPGICYHLNISEVHAEHVIAVLRKARDRMLSVAGCSRE